LSGWRHIALLLGGAAANAAVGVSILATIAGWRSPISLVGLFGGLLSCGMAALSLVPASSPITGLPSDGLQLIRLVIGQAPRGLARQILTETIAGKRPRDWTVSLTACVEAAAKDDGWATLFAYSRAVDEGVFTTARQMLERALTSQDLGVRTDVALQAAMFHALVDRDAARARAALTHDAGTSDRSYSKLAEAAVLVAEGRNSEARAARDEWLAHLSPSGEARALRMGSNEWALDALGRALDGEPEGGAD
jgi:hypothetical protein